MQSVQTPCCSHLERELGKSEDSAHFVLNEVWCSQAIFQFRPMMSISTCSITRIKAEVTFNVVQQKSILKGPVNDWSQFSTIAPPLQWEILFMSGSPAWLNSFSYQWMDQVRKESRFVLVINCSLCWAKDLQRAMLMKSTPAVCAASVALLLTAMHNPDAQTHKTHKLPAQVLRIINVFPLCQHSGLVKQMSHVRHPRCLLCVFYL